MHKPDFSAFMIKPCQGHKFPEKVWTERPEQLSSAQVAWDLLSEDGELASMRLTSKFEGICKDGFVPDAVSVEYAQGNYRHLAGLVNPVTQQPVQAPALSRSRMRG